MTAAILSVGVALRPSSDPLVDPPPLVAAPVTTFAYPAPRPPVTPAAPLPVEEEVVAAETTATSQPAAPPEPPPEPEPEPEPPPPPPPAPSCSTELAGTRPHVAAVGRHLAVRFGVPLSDIGGRASRPGNPTSDHPRGLALDFMVGRSRGDEIADYALENRDRFGIKYVIWRQRINHGSGWEPMEDRGSATANHYDHVHLSFESSLADALLAELTC